MNSLYTSGVRQTNSLQADLERLRNGDNSASLLGVYSMRSSAGLSMSVKGSKNRMLTIQGHTCFIVRADIRFIGRYAPDCGRLRLDGEAGDYQDEAREGTNVRICLCIWCHSLGTFRLLLCLKDICYI